MAWLDDQIANLQKMYGTNQQNQIQQAQAARDQNVNQLNRQLADQLPTYQTQRNQTDVQSAVDMQKAKELMANMGAYNSGDNITQQGRLMTNRNNAMSTINSSENQYRKGISDKISDANTSFGNSQTSITNQNAVDLAKAIQAVREQQQQYDVQAQEAQKARDFQSQQSELAYQRQQQEQAAQREFEKQQALDNYNRQLAMQQKQYEQQLALARSKSSGSGGGGGSNSSSANKQQLSQMAWQELANQNSKGTDYTWLMKNKTSLVKDVGQDQWDQMKKAVIDDSKKKAQASKLASMIMP